MSSTKEEDVSVVIGEVGATVIEPVECRDGGKFV